MIYTQIRLQVKVVKKTVIPSKSKLMVFLRKQNHLSYYLNDIKLLQQKKQVVGPVTRLKGQTSTDFTKSVINPTELRWYDFVRRL